MDLGYLGTCNPLISAYGYRGTYNVYTMWRYEFKPDSLSKSTFEQNDPIPFLDGIIPA